MAQAKRDENRVTTLLAVSSVDGVTPVVVYADPTTHRLLTDTAAGSGTVTSVSVVTANGFAGTVATATTTPAITITTSITGVLKGNGTAISAATDGTDYLSSTTGLKLDQTSAQTISNDSPIFNTLTASELVATTAAKKLQSLAVATYPSLTEISYVKGVTSAIQTQLGTKQATITFGTGVQTALGVNVGSAGAPVLFNGALGTPSSGTVTNLTGTASININGTVGATTPTTATFTTATINTSLLPDANDGAVLGAALTAFSDLFLAEGGVINWDNGDVTLTQAGNNLNLAGGDFTLNNGSEVMTINNTTITVSGDVMGIVCANGISLNGSTSGISIVGGPVVLSENTSIRLDPAGSADGKYTGITVTGTAGYTQAFGDLVYLDPTDSRWEAVDANAASGADGDARGIIGMVVSAGTDGTACTILLQGIIRADANFPALTINAPVYAAETAGDIVVTQPTTADVVIRVVGFALTADEIYFNPSPDYITHT